MAIYKLNRLALLDIEVTDIDDDVNDNDAKVGSYCYSDIKTVTAEYLCGNCPSLIDIRNNMDQTPLDIAVQVS